MTSGETKEAFEAAEVVDRIRIAGKRTPLEVVDHPAEKNQVVLLSATILRSASRNEALPTPTQLVRTLEEQGMNVDHRHAGSGNQVGYTDASNLSKKVRKAMKFFEQRDGDAFAEEVVKRLEMGAL